MKDKFALVWRAAIPAKAAAYSEGAPRRRNYQWTSRRDIRKSLIRGQIAPSCPEKSTKNFSEIPYFPRIRALAGIAVWRAAARTVWQAKLARSATVAALVPGAGAQAGQDALRERAVLVSRRPAGIRADVRNAAGQTPPGGLRPGPPVQQIQRDRGHQQRANGDRPLSHNADKRPSRFRHPHADEGEA